MKAWRGYRGAEVRVVQNMRHGAMVEHLWVPPEQRRQGVASRLMRAVCAEADREFVVLALEAIPFAWWPDETVDRVHLPEITRPSELRAFYRRFGFPCDPHQVVRMRRYPKG